MINILNSGAGLAGDEEDIKLVFALAAEGKAYLQ